MYYLALFCFDFFTSAHKDNSHLYPRSRAICKQLLSHGGIDNCILFTFRRLVRLCSSSFCPVSISIFILTTDTGNTDGPEMDK